jgi:uncharacterized protein
MPNNRVVHFEIPANDPQALTKFYAELFGWTFSRLPNPMVEYWNCTTGANGPGINGGIVKKQNPTHPCMNYVDVGSIDQAIDKAETLGAKLALPKIPIPGIGAIACMIDPEGNMFGLVERKAD